MDRITCITLLVFLALPAFAEETPSAVPAPAAAVVIDATEAARLKLENAALKKVVEQLDAQRAEAEARLARNEFYLRAVLRDLPDGEIKQFIRWYLTRISERMTP